jgi:hypothetical protein
LELDARAPGDEDSRIVASNAGSAMNRPQTPFRPQFIRAPSPRNRLSIR